MLKSRVKVIWIGSKLTHLFLLELTQELEFSVTSFYFWPDLDLKLDHGKTFLKREASSLSWQVDLFLES
jgi:hypothetical protein